MSKHPRLIHYPHHQDYMDMDGGETRPFVMFVNKPRFRSPAVNTDAFGLRETYDAQGQFLDLNTLAQRYDHCNVLVGASSAFGVDATADRTTIAGFLSAEREPCVNLAIRGATSQQEVIAFHLFKKYLPQVENIILFTGVNNIALSSLDDALFFPDFGGLFCEDQHATLFFNQYERFGASRAFLERRSFEQFLGRLHARSALLRRLVRLFSRWRLRKLDRPRQSFAEKTRIMTDVFLNDIDTWSYVQRATDCRVHLVLQPVIAWTRKALTQIESSCFQADLKLIPSMSVYTKMAVHDEYASALRGKCSESGIGFYDANDWFNDPDVAAQDLFTDACHLTDLGYQLIADRVRPHLQ